MLDLIFIFKVNWLIYLLKATLTSLTFTLRFFFTSGFN